MATDSGALLILREALSISVLVPEGIPNTPAALAVIGTRLHAIGERLKTLTTAYGLPEFPEHEQALIDSVFDRIMRFTGPVGSGTLTGDLANAIVNDLEKLRAFVETTELGEPQG